MQIQISGTRLVDEFGQTLILRGVNLGGSSKLPRTPDGATHRRDGFFDHRTVSFVGRPFPLAEAEEHFARLRAWGLTFLRFLVTWEAIEHAGPGLYDEAYLDYLAAVVAKAGEHGLSLFIDPHQDVWSRFSGGDGAPGWTLEAAGFDITSFQATGAAIVHATHGDPFPRMIWPTNGWKLAAATMYSLFFGGDDFAPATQVDGEPIQGYLQRHYLAAMQQVALRLRGMAHVVGYDVFNEPMAGFIGLRDLSRPASPLPHGEHVSPFQAMLLGAGQPQQVALWQPGVPSRRVGSRLVNPEGRSAWLPGHDCIWRANRVWDVDAGGRPVLLRPQHFCYQGGRFVDFGRDYLRPFANRYAAAIRAVDPEALIFVQPEAVHGSLGWGAGDAERVIYAPHWYDSLLLFSKRYLPGAALDAATRRLVLGPGPVRRHFAAALSALIRQGADELGAPTIIGETGIPFDLTSERTFRGGAPAAQERAMARLMRALDDSLASATLWNYTADNSAARGDGWNGEDLSIFSRDQQHDPADLNSGGRALRAFLRPYARAVAGEPLLMQFDPASGRFTLHFRPDYALDAPTEIFVPHLHYPGGPLVTVRGGAAELDIDHQLLSVQAWPGYELCEVQLDRPRV